MAQQQFLDHENGWTDPASTSNRYLRQDNAWAAADDSHGFLAPSGWATPVLRPRIPASQAEFNAASWADLEKLSADCAKSGSGDYTSLLGLTKDASVSGVGTVKTMLIGLDHDTLTAGGKAGFSFQLRDGLSSSAPTAFRMNGSGTNSGGWAVSEMRTTNLPKLLAALPSDLRSRIKKVNKSTSTANSGTAVSTTSDDLFLLSLIEAIGTTKTSYTDNPVASGNYLYNEGTQYEYYAQFDSNKTNAFNAYIVKNASGSNESWWFRSIRLGYGADFYLAKTSNDWYDYDCIASRSWLPAAGFCL